MSAPVEVAGVMMHAPALPPLLHTAPGIRVRGTSLYQLLLEQCYGRLPQ